VNPRKHSRLRELQTGRKVRGAMIGLWRFLEEKNKPFMDKYVEAVVRGLPVRAVYEEDGDEGVITLEILPEINTGTGQ
jgi:hypothetical protein